MKTTRLPLLLLMVVLSIEMFGRTQESTTAASTNITWSYEACSLSPNRDTSAVAVTDLPQQVRIILGRKADEDILKLYYDISALPLKKRRASFRSLSPNVKSDLWKTQLAIVLVKRQLNELQKAVILSAMSLVTPEFFAVRSSDPAWKTKVQEPSRSLEERIVSAFSWEDASKIFAKLGAEAESANITASVLLNINYKPLSDSGPFNEWRRSRFAAQDFELEQTACQCSTQSDYCPVWGYCRGSGCNPTESGCGTFWSYPCNGASCQ